MQAVDLVAVAVDQRHPRALMIRSTFAPLGLAIPGALFAVGIVTAGTS